MGSPQGGNYKMDHILGLECIFCDAEYGVEYACDGILDVACGYMFVAQRINPESVLSALWRSGWPK